jgi:ATP-binding cassette subfamily F protein uup
MTLIHTSGLHMDFGFGPLLEDAQISLEAGERVCLVGRNGQGKTTLMKILAGILEPDDGEVHLAAGTRVAYLPQAVPDELEGRLLDVVAGGTEGCAALLDDYDALSGALSDPPRPEELDRMQALQEELDRRDGWGVRETIQGALGRLGLDPEGRFEALSGGRKRQCLLIRALVSKPSVLILDEPTNHLDITAIEWLETLVKGFQGVVLFVTHDRAFLRSVATRILDLDRGKLTSWPGDYTLYLERKQAALEAESRAWDEFDKKLAKEEVWIRQGIKARRTRNEGRVRALERLREQRKARRKRIGAAKITIHESGRSGARVIEATDVCFAWPDQPDQKPLVDGFSLELQRGDRLGIIGPNGCGKTTLLRLLLEELEPQSGTVVVGTKLAPIYFDQMRGQLDEEKTVQENLAADGDTVLMNGRSRHIIGYLGDFLFSPDRARSPVRLLSGGERNRLLLAKLFIQEANLLILDEPTNDLDAETLELLETTLLDYGGTLILVSHDREFLNNVVTSCVAFDEDGEVRHYAGGYDDWLLQRPALAVDQPESGDPVSATGRGPEAAPIRVSKPKLGYLDQREFDSLPREIEALEVEQTGLTTQIMAPAFYERPADDVRVTTDRLAEIESLLSRRYARWESLDAKTEELQP